MTKYQKDTYKCFIVKILYYYLSKVEITTIVVGGKHLPINISDICHNYLAIATKTLYKQYIHYLLNYEKSDYLDKLKILYFSNKKFNLNDSKTICVNILLHAEQNATSKNKPTIEIIRNHITYNVLHFT